MKIYAASYLLPINGSPIAGGAVAVEGGKIAAVGRLADLRREISADIVEFPGCVLLPGLVNAHTHLELTDFPAWRDAAGFDSVPLSYCDWIIQVIKIKRTLNYESLAASLLKGLQLSLQYGTTSVGDNLSDRRLIPLYSNTAVAGRVYLEFIGKDPAKYLPLLDSYERDVALLPTNLLPGISPHAPFTVAKELLKLLVSKGETLNLPFSMHLAESFDEVSFFRDSTGEIAEKLYPFVEWQSYLPDSLKQTSVEWVAACRGLSENLLAVHCVHLSNSDIVTLKKRGVSIALSPRSNHSLGVGTAPVAAIKAAGIPLALGTDSLASCESLSLWDEMRYLLDIYPEIFSPKDAIEMATSGGAEAIGRSAESGSIEIGKRADFIAVQTGGKPLLQKLYEQLVTDSKVCTVWCGGEKIWSAGD